MAKLFFLIVILCASNFSITISNNINNRITNQASKYIHKRYNNILSYYIYIGDEEPKTTQNNTTDFWSVHLKTDHCIPVIAVKELGCTLSEKNPIFKKLFRSVCEQHQLCYTCVSYLSNFQSKKISIFIIGICT